MSVASAQTTNRPALGAYLNTPELQEAREHAMWLSRMSRLDYSARTRAYARIVDISEAIRTGQRLDIIATHLLVLATQLEDVVQPKTGGWPISYRSMVA